ncbi:hypothetical protein KKC60_00920, partial [Patescibacteria group bacterium]|nr:hypothetical protein [Patescibacteria group bacterium]
MSETNPRSSSPEEIQREVSEEKVNEVATRVIDQNLSLVRTPEMMTQAYETIRSECSPEEALLVFRQIFETNRFILSEDFVDVLSQYPADEMDPLLKNDINQRHEEAGQLDDMYKIYDVAQYTSFLVSVLRDENYLSELRRNGFESDNKIWQVASDLFSAVIKRLQESNSITDKTIEGYVYELVQKERTSGLGKVIDMIQDRETIGRLVHNSLESPTAYVWAFNSLIEKVDAYSDPELLSDIATNQGVGIGHRLMALKRLSFADVSEVDVANYEGLVEDSVERRRQKGFFDSSATVVGCIEKGVFDMYPEVLLRLAKMQTEKDQKLANQNFKEAVSARLKSDRLMVLFGDNLDDVQNHLPEIQETRQKILKIREA